MATLLRWKIDGVHPAFDSVETALYCGLPGTECAILLVQALKVPAEGGEVIMKVAHVRLDRGKSLLKRLEDAVNNPFHHRLRHGQSLARRSCPRLFMAVCFNQGHRRGAYLSVDDLTIEVAGLTMQARCSKRSNMPRVQAAVIAALLVTGCATKPSTVMVWARTDGQAITGNAALTQQYDVDRTVCVGEVQKANVSDFTFASNDISAMVAQIEANQAASIIYRGCMASRGYLKVRKS